MRLIEVLELLICLLAVLGLYGLFVRLVIWLGREERVGAVCAEDKSLEEICIEVELLRLRGFKKTVILIEKENSKIEKALLSEGFLVYLRKEEK